MGERRASLSELSLAFAVGALAGAALALLFAPASGKETRGRIRDSAGRAYDAGRRGLEAGRARVGRAYAAARGRFHHEDPAAEA